MKSIPGSLMFIAASLYLAIEGNFDVITVLAILICASCSVIALNKHSLWAVVGGVGLVSVSLILQSLTGYCMTCLRADIIILGATLSVAYIQTGKVKLYALGMTGVVVILLLIATRTVVSLEVTTTGLKHPVVDKIPTKVEQLAQEKPVYIFSPKCPSCQTVTEFLIKNDPTGKTWVPSLSGGDEKDALKYLRDKGYKGDMIAERYSGPIPTLVYKEGIKIQSIKGIEPIKEIYEELNRK